MMYHLSESHLSTHNTRTMPSSSAAAGIIPSLNHNKCLCYYVNGEYDASKPEEDEDDSRSCHHPRCGACVRRILQPHLDRHAQAITDRDKAREECARQLNALPNHHSRLGELQAESQRLRERLTVLRKQCADRGVRVASQAVENDLRREAMQFALSARVGTEEPQQQLQRLEQSLLHGSLHHAIDVASRQVRVLRFQWARKALAMHRLDIDTNDVKSTPLQQRRETSTSASSVKGKLSAPRRARGIGKIGGLPLPHAGQELYGVLPPKELQSALRLVASVTCTVARCLGIVLPHPILLTPTTGGSTMGNGDITDTVSDHELQRRLRESHHATSLVDDGTHPLTTPRTAISTSRSIPYDTPHNHPPSGSSSLYSLMDTSYWKRSAKNALARATGHTASSSLSTAFSGPATSSSSASASPSVSFVAPSMDSSELSLRIHHATAAVLAEDSSPSSSKFALSAEVMHQQDFAIALQLLQNNVIVLCIRAGVPVSKLWPAEAVLLNLYQLDQYCQEQTAVSF